MSKTYSLSLIHFDFTTLSVAKSLLVPTEDKPLECIFSL